MINVIIEIIATLADVFFLVWFVSSFHNVSIRKRSWPLVWAVLLFGYQVLIDTLLPETDMVALVGTLLFSVCFSLSLQHKKYIRAFLAALLYLIVIILTDNIVDSWLSLVVDNYNAVNYGAGSYLRVTYLLVCKILNLAFYRLLLKIFGKDKTYDWKTGFLSFTFTIVTAYALVFLMKLGIENPYLKIEIIVFHLASLLVFLNFILFAMNKQVHALMKNKYDLMLIQDRMKFEKNRVEEAAVIWKNIRQVKHDLENHFAIMSRHLSDGDIESCQKYVSKLHTTIETMGNMIQSGNSVIDYLINSKLACLEGVTVLVSGYVGNYSDIDDVDLACILGNILDNAIEAQEKLVSEKRIELLFLHRKSNRIARTVPDDESNVCKLGHADIFSLIVTISRRLIFGRHLNGIEACAAVARLGTNVIYGNLGIVLLGVVALNQGINAIAVTDKDFMTAV